MRPDRKLRGQFPAILMKWLTWSWRQILGGICLSSGTSSGPSNGRAVWGTCRWTTCSTPESRPPPPTLLRDTTTLSTKCQKSKKIAIQYLYIERDTKWGRVLPRLCAVSFFVSFHYISFIILSFLIASDYIIDNTMPMVKLANGNSNDGEAR